MSEENNLSPIKNNEQFKPKYPISELNLALRKAYKNNNCKKLIRILNLVKPTIDEILSVMSEYTPYIKVINLPNLEVILQYLGKTSSKLLLKYRYNKIKNNHYARILIEILLDIITFVKVFKSKINLPITNKYGSLLFNGNLLRNIFDNVNIQNWKASITKIFIKDKNLMKLCKIYNDQYSPKKYDLLIN